MGAPAELHGLVERFGRNRSGWSRLRAIERDLRRNYAREYRVLRADSGHSALDTLEKVKERGDPVALMLVDQRMPRMSGVEFLEEARDMFPDAKRALLTAYADTDAAISASPGKGTYKVGGTEKSRLDNRAGVLSILLVTYLVPTISLAFSATSLFSRFFARRSSSRRRRDPSSTRTIDQIR